MKYYIGIDLGGTNIAGGLVDENGKILKKISVPTEVERGENAIIDNIADLCGKICDESNIKLSQVEKIGIGVPGTVDSENGMIMFACNLNFNKVSIKPIEEKCGVSVKILNDADAAAYGEYVASGSKADSFICITLGTGIGSGIIINGKIYNGFNGAGGEIGHVVVDKHETEVCGCGKKGCLEQYASANGIVRMTKKALATETRDTILNTIENLTAKDIFDAAKSNDTVAAEQVEKMGNILGTALASIACVINPERIVIGGGVSKAGKILIDVIEKHFMEQTFHACRNAEFALAELGNDAGIYGGACLILQNA